MIRTFVFTALLLLVITLTPAYASLGFLSVFVPRTHPTCLKAYPPSHTKFCPTFKASAECACTSSGMPSGMCHDMSKLYKRMLMVFSTQKKACEFQRDTSMARCNDSWNCYRNGGKDSAGKACQNTGKACDAG